MAWAYKKKCLLVAFEDFEALLNDYDYTVRYSYDGVEVYFGDEMIDDEKLCQILTDIINDGVMGDFGKVRITSFHADDCDEMGIWLVYSPLNGILAE